MHMSKIWHSVAPDIAALIERLVRERMSAYALRSITIRAGEDHDGDPAIYIEVHHDLSETPIDPEVNAQLSFDLWQLLEEAGETAFPMSGPSITSSRRSRPAGGGRRDRHGTSTGRCQSNQAAAIRLFKKRA
jgi:hypothetical protein